MGDNTGTEDWGSKVKRILTAVWNYGSDPPVPKPAAGTEIGDVMEDGKIYAGTDPDGLHMYVKRPKNDPKIGDELPDGRFYAGISSRTGANIYVGRDDGYFVVTGVGEAGVAFGNLRKAAAQPGADPKLRVFVDSWERAADSNPDEKLFWTLPGTKAIKPGSPS